jgi:hypothetical protein
MQNGHKIHTESFLMAFLKLQRFREKYLGIIVQTFVNTVDGKIANHGVYAHGLRTGYKSAMTEHKTQNICMGAERDKCRE